MQEQEAKQNQALEATKQSILDILEQAGLSFEAFIRHNAKAVRRIVAKIEREEAKAAPPEKRVAKKTATKKRRRKAAKAKKPTIKIPAGKYTNIPGAEETVFEVKDKGARPKVLKAYAEQLGLEEFLKQCRVD